MYMTNNSQQKPYSIFSLSNTQSENVTSNPGMHLILRSTISMFVNFIYC